jgi:hypothetical protein
MSLPAAATPNHVRSRIVMPASRSATVAAAASTFAFIAMNTPVTTSQMPD